MFISATLMLVIMNYVKDELETRVLRQLAQLISYYNTLGRQGGQ